MQVREAEADPGMAVQAGKVVVQEDREVRVEVVPEEAEARRRSLAKAASLRVPQAGSLAAEAVLPD
jgi:hypothetical protein